MTSYNMTNKILGLTAAMALMMGATGCGKSVTASFNSQSSTGASSEELPGGGTSGGGTSGGTTGGSTSGSTGGEGFVGNIDCKVYDVSAAFAKQGCGYIRPNSNNLSDNVNSPNPDWGSQLNCLKLPDLATLEPIGVMKMKNFDVSDRDWLQGFPGLNAAGAGHLREYFALSCVARIQIAQSGLQTFLLNADDGAKLYIDGRTVIDNDGNHPMTQKSGTIALDHGSYKMRIEWYQGPRDRIALQLGRGADYTQFQTVPQQDFLHDSASDACVYTASSVSSN